MSEEGESEQDDDEDAIPEADSSEENEEGNADASSDDEGDKKPYTGLEVDTLITPDFPDNAGRGFLQ